MKISIFLPIRKGSERVHEKSTRPFGNLEGGLLQLKLKQLAALEQVAEIVLSTNDEKAMNIAQSFGSEIPNLKIVQRPEHLAASHTKLVDLIAHVAEITTSEHILWTHVTSPFCTAKHYSEAITTYFENRQHGYDSLMGVREFKNYLWDPFQKDIINRKNDVSWPRTQDLKDLYEINNAVFIAAKCCYISHKNRVGTIPFLYEMNKLSSTDIDDEEDFKIAEKFYDTI